MIWEVAGASPSCYVDLDRPLPSKLRPVPHGNCRERQHWSNSRKNKTLAAAMGAADYARRAIGARQLGVR